MDESFLLRDGVCIPRDSGYYTTSNSLLQVRRTTDQQSDDLVLFPTATSFVNRSTPFVVDRDSIVGPELSASKERKSCLLNIEDPNSPFSSGT